MRHAFDIGGQTLAALTRFVSSGDPSSSGIAVWNQGGCHAAGNGSLMRCTPIALIVEREHQRDAAVHDSLITHADPRCVLACARYVAAIDAGVSGANPQAMLAAARDGGKPAAAALLDLMPEHAEAINAATGDLDLDLELAAADDPDLYGAIDMVGAASGFVRVAFRLAFWELLHAHDYQAGLFDVVNRGGDADTNGAIVGGLLGARYGAGQIPAPWRDAVLGCKPQEPWDGAYHPRVLLAAFEALREPRQP